MLVFVALSGLACAVGLDFIEGLERDHALNIYARAADHYDFEAWTQARFRHSEYSTVVHFSKSVEETLEMLVMSLLWFVFLQHLLGSADVLEVRRAGRRKRPRQRYWRMRIRQWSSKEVLSGLLSEPPMYNCVWLSSIVGNS